MAVGRFAVIAIEYSATGSGMQVTIMTNAACHLWLRYSLVEPRTHKIPILRRGVYFRTDIRLCFVAYHDNEQSEAGDTWLHTFVKEPWPVCQTRWFMFWGTIDGQPSPSTSGIFKYHRTALPPAGLYCLRNTDNTHANSIWGPRELACSFKPTTPYKLTHLGCKWTSTPYPPDPLWMRYCIYPNTAENKPDLNPIASTGYHYPPWPTNLDEFTMWELQTPIVLQAGVTYWHILHIGPPDGSGYDYCSIRSHSYAPADTCYSGLNDYYGYNRSNDLIHPPGDWSQLQLSHEYKTFGYPAVLPPFEQQLEYDTGNVYCQPWNACAQTFSPRTNHRITYLKAVLSGFPPAYCKGPYRVMLERYTDPQYPGDRLAQVEDYFDPGGADGPATWYTWNFPPVDTFPDDKLRLVIIGYGEWGIFSGGRWDYGHSHINMLWWYASENPYPRGCMQTGYNYDTNSGSYSSYANSDRTFVEGGFLL